MTKKTMANGDYGQRRRWTEKTMGRRDYRQKRPWTMAKETMAQRKDGRRELAKGDYGQMKPEDHDTRRSRVRAMGNGKGSTMDCSKG